MALDVNDYDVPENVLNPEVHEYLVEKDKASELESLIKSQYINFDSLGNNYLKNSENTLIDIYYKRQILKNMLIYVNDAYLSIVDIDSVDDDSNRLDLIGSYIYEFICVDAPNSLIPSFFELLSINSLEEFDMMFNLKYTQKPNVFKTDFIKTVELTITQLNKLAMINPAAKNDDNYNRLLSKYLFFKETLEYCDPEKIITGYIRPVVNKYISEITWRRL